MASGSMNPARLTLARRRRGMTMTRLAEGIGVDARTVSAWEHGEFQPDDARRVSQISKALGFPVGFFYGDNLEEPTPEGASFRAFTKMSAAQRDCALGAGALAYVLNDWIEKRFELPDPHLPELGRNLDPESAADTLRQLWGLGELPIKNMIHLLESKGIRVFSLSIDAAEVDAFSVWRDSRPFVFLNTNKSAEHSRFDAAHELGHLVMHRHGSPQGQLCEQEANSFASSFLMPRRSILAQAPKMPSVAHLVKAKKYWGVSVAALAYRLSSLKAVTEWHYRSLCIDIAKKGYRKHEPEEMRRETSQVLAKVLSALREDGVSKADIASQLNLAEEEIETLVFGLTVTGLCSVGGGSSKNKTGKPMLRVV